MAFYQCRKVTPGARGPRARRAPAASQTASKSEFGDCSPLAPEYSATRDCGRARARKAAQLRAAPRSCGLRRPFAPTGLSSHAPLIASFVVRFDAISHAW